MAMANIANRHIAAMPLHATKGQSNAKPLRRIAPTAISKTGSPAAKAGANLPGRMAKPRTTSTNPSRSHNFVVPDWSKIAAMPTVAAGGTTIQ
jgi:hypothetical protein